MELNNFKSCTCISCCIISVASVPVSTNNQYIIRLSICHDSGISITVFHGIIRCICNFCTAVIPRQAVIGRAFNYYIHAMDIGVLIPLPIRPEPAYIGSMIVS